MTEVFAGAENVISSLGFTADENVENILLGNSGIVIDESNEYAPVDLPLSKIDHALIKGDSSKYTLMERMFIQSIEDSLAASSVDASSPETLFIFTTTKGNIELLDPEIGKNFDKERIHLHEMASAISRYFNNPNTPLIVSNACISGVLGIVYAERLVRSGKYRNVIVSGGDIMSEFIVSGFLSFQSLSEKPCKPFDKDRSGLTLGEGCGTLVLSNDRTIFKDVPVKVTGGAGSNDANHISGPSRTGEGLFIAVSQAMKQAGMEASDIDFLSAHGTATDYNDEMEAKAFGRIGLQHVPVNSFKGYIGHTLGAAGVIESALCLQSMRRNTLFRSAGYENHGVSIDLNIIKENTVAEINTCLKTGSGFGGSNAAVVFQKIS
ncbi:MAG: beta-ketoacyl synthase N-terminal-like domain-containing protein [Bacteroidales bacterium]|jgi:3-oxoacyl-[acyl-carrier-protein] synthase-1|nr:beta-ketoacyl synthase N-terminal-like domain-containing protein [Bacteroidales bacterium]